MPLAIQDIGYAHVIKRPNLRVSPLFGGQAADQGAAGEGVGH